jgi:hypothetical protein
MSQILVKCGFFFEYNGQPEGAMLLCGDLGNTAKRNAYMAYLDKHNLDTALICLNNEELMSVFNPRFMQEPFDLPRCGMVLDYIQQLKARRKYVAILFYDGPAIPGGKYHPILAAPVETHKLFLKIACEKLNPIVDMYLLGCETDRYFSDDRVEDFIGCLKENTMRYVGTHACVTRKVNGKWTLIHRVPRNCDFLGVELTNSPGDGDNRSVADMVEEVTFLANNSGGKPLWVMEHNIRPWGAIARKQADGMAAVNGVYGMNY